MVSSAPGGLQRLFDQHGGILTLDQTLELLLKVYQYEPFRSPVSDDPLNPLTLQSQHWQCCSSFDDKRRELQRTVLRLTGRSAHDGINSRLFMSLQDVEPWTFTLSEEVLAAIAPPEEKLTFDGVEAAFVCFQNSYNANDVAKCGGMYTDPCHVTVNGGAVAGGFGPFTTPAEVSSFLGRLRNDLGGTNIQFKVISVDGHNHKDTWVADNGTGSCDADWSKTSEGWRICKDVITFTPHAPVPEEEKVASGEFSVQVRTQGADGQPDHFKLSIPDGSNASALKQAIELSRGTDFAADSLRLIIAGKGVLADDDILSGAHPVVCIRMSKCTEEALHEELVTCTKVDDTSETGAGYSQRVPVVKLEEEEEAAPVPEDPELSKALARARKKFDQLDADGSGSLEGDELIALADWVWSSFRAKGAQGKTLSASEKREQGTKLLGRLDANQDGSMSFDEFSGWFKRTCASIQKFKQGQSAKDKSAPPPPPPAPAPAPAPAPVPAPAPAPARRSKSPTKSSSQREFARNLQRAFSPQKVRKQNTGNAPQKVRKPQPKQEIAAPVSDESKQSEVDVKVHDGLRSQVSRMNRDPSDPLWEK